jgi:hypothetical protein
MNPLLTQALVAPHIADLRRSACLSHTSAASTAPRSADAINRGVHDVAGAPKSRLITTLLREPVPCPCDVA